MRVLVAGGTGFVGSAISKALAAAGHHVTKLSRSRPSGGSDEKGIQADVARAGAWQASLKGQDAVVNAVGLLRETRLATFQGAVVDGTRHLVEAAVAARVRRFVQVSANGVDAAQVPYQRTKLEAEAVVKSSGIPWTILRPSVIFGPGDGLTNQLARLMRWRVLPYFGRGDYRLAPVAIEDVAGAAVACLTRKAALSATFQMCGPRSLTYRELLREIRTASGRRCWIVRAPKWTGFALAGLLGRFRWFPADRDALRMLFQGNTCWGQDWTQVLGVVPRPFPQGADRYLSRR